MTRPLPLILFAAAALSPLALLALGATLGGIWPLCALTYMALATILLDLLIPLAAGQSDDHEFPAADALLVSLGAGTMIALPALVWAIAGNSLLGPLPRVALFVAAGLWFGQVSHPAAHELIHRPQRPLFALGIAVYTALLFGHHASSHRLVHHRHVASPADPNTAKVGESYYRFLPRAWIGSFRQGWRAETALRQNALNLHAPNLHAPNMHERGLHPYVLYLGGAALALASGYLIAGLPGLLVWAGLGLHAGTQILLSDYVQHYGMQRGLVGTKLAPVTAAHSWNTPHWFSSALMLNAPRHSDHHSHPTRAFPALRLPAEAPILPWPLPLACLIALVPSLWCPLMQRELDRLAPELPQARFPKA